MSVDDFGIEVLKKAAEEITAGDKSEYILRVKSLPIGLAIHLNLGLSGFSIQQVSGRNPNIGIANEEDVLDNGGTYSFLTSATTLNVKSTSANDTSAGTGARTVQVIGLNSSYDSVTETVTLNGTSNVATINSFIRIQSLKVLTAGSSEENEGTITIQSGVNVLSSVLAGFNQSLSTVFTIPNNRNGYIPRIFGSIIESDSGTGKKTGELVFLYRPFGSVFYRSIQFGLSTDGSSYQNVSIDTYLKFEAKTDLKMLFFANQNNTKVMSGYDLILEDTSV